MTTKFKSAFEELSLMVKATPERTVMEALVRSDIRDNGLVTDFTHQFLFNHGYAYQNGKLCLIV